MSALYFMFNFLSFFILILVSCSSPKAEPQTTDTTQVTTPPATDTEPQNLALHGKEIYNTYCIACHNPDPSLDGAIGPAIKGSSEALIEARVIHGTYPSGYKPKRDSQAMIPMPHLVNDIKALAEYLK